MAKGAGMIHPHLATMLCFITSDVVITPPALIRAFKNAVNKSFNSITVDGQMSTNDMALILANGLAGNPKVILGTKNFHYFSEGLDLICLRLAQDVIRDAEGATKFVEIIVKGARNTKDAKRVGFAVANSSLVKTSLFGEDPNWGRIAASVGSSGVNFNPERLKISLGSIEVLKGNSPLDVGCAKLKKVFQKDEIKIVVDLNIGSSEAIVYTSDLSTEYVKINARYKV
jgi:glutamate N-acetyltransferase/amino-acid N-acetyltransferase